MLKYYLKKPIYSSPSTVTRAEEIQSWVFTPGTIARPSILKRSPFGWTEPLVAIGPDSISLKQHAKINIACRKRHTSDSLTCSHMFACSSSITVRFLFVNNYNRFAEIMYLMNRWMFLQLLSVLPLLWGHADVTYTKKKKNFIDTQDNSHDPSVNILRCVNWDLSIVKTVHVWNESKQMIMGIHELVFFSSIAKPLSHYPM